MSMLSHLGLTFYCINGTVFTNLLYKSLQSIVLSSQALVLCRLGSHLSPTETVCYLTADMFYIEVVLLLGGKVEDVRVAHHGEAPVVREMFTSLFKNAVNVYM